MELDECNIEFLDGHTLRWYVDGDGQQQGEQTYYNKSKEIAEITYYINGEEVSEEYYKHHLIKQRLGQNSPPL